MTKQQFELIINELKRSISLWLRAILWFRWLMGLLCSTQRCTLSWALKGRDRYDQICNEYAPHDSIQPFIVLEQVIVLSCCTNHPRVNTARGQMDITLPPTTKTTVICIRQLFSGLRCISIITWAFFGITKLPFNGFSIKDDFWQIIWAVMYTAEHNFLKWQENVFRKAELNQFG